MKELIITIIATLILIITCIYDIFGQESLQEKDLEVNYTLNGNGPSGSHQKFTEQSLNILKNDKGEEMASFFDEYKTLLLEYCDKPDKDETAYIFAYHFYNPYTKHNFLPSIFKSSKITALIKFQSHIKNAVKLYFENREESIKELGRAIHFLEDINVPHHSANLIAGLSSHIQYESYIDEDESKFFVNTSNAYDKYSECSFDDYCENLFEECAVNSYFYKNMIKFSKRSQWDRAAYPTLKLAQENIASLLYRFIKEVENK